MCSPSFLLHSYRLSFTIVLKYYCAKIQNFLLTRHGLLTYDNYHSNRIL